ncbi:putative myb DNA-binding domain-protein [Podospora aff. communis PSN243]|uniref:Myb DNA-binding domain-protein n=1 Tax=Podospora aff. communis PSN243 TaxID=3040156 RepID=A0AAV9GYL5_9PEZI|nr:putative myb DNA-binding domain-protein [Podospora aff. communis PSN243]
MATIEPRLIHLLNTQTPSLPPIQLPPLEGRADETLSLPPLEHDQTHKAQDKPPTPIPQLPITGDDASRRQTYQTLDNTFGNDASLSSASSRLNKSARPLQMLLGDAEANTSTLSLRKLVEETNSPESFDDIATKKRHRALTTKDDFVQLPQPLKKQKSTQQVVPPIIAGLHEPPPNAAVFPPITSNTFDNSDTLSLSAHGGFPAAVDDRAAGNASHASDGGDKNANGAAKGKRRAAKPRRKWSDEETNHLLLGVSRHGVGKWTSILEDSDFRFNDRSAGDLKDRFRTCCPDELRSNSTPVGNRKQRSGGGEENGMGNDYGQGKAEWTPASEDGIPYSSHIKSRNGPQLENILIEPESGSNSATPGPPSASSNDSDSAPANRQQRKSRAHRKKMEDLVELGIHGPFKKSHRRERRPFTDQDDKEILEGLDQYGPAWTKIQRDRRFNLSTRQPTDLRDRVRNKYPEIYQRIEKGVFHIKGDPKTASSRPLEPMVNTTIEKTLQQHIAQQQELNRSSSREDMVMQGPPPNKRLPPAGGFYDSTESLPGLADMLEMSGPPPTVSLLQQMQAAPVGGAFLSPGEMDISRLLLDDGSGPDYRHHHPQPPQPPPPHARYGQGQNGGYDYGAGR